MAADDLLVDLVQRTHLRLRPGSILDPPPEIAFYPYTDAKSTVRERGRRLHFRLSDQLKEAPDQVLEGVVGVLLCRILGLPAARADPDAVRAYRRYLVEHLPARRGHHAAGEGGQGHGPAARRSSGRKHIDPVGAHRSLLESYLRVSMDMDLALPRVPKLSWSKTVSGHRFGHWDEDHNVVVISQILDDPDVPEFVLDYVLYHELLHILHPVRMGSGTKRIVHSAAFRRDERRFPRWKDGDEWIERLARQHRARRRRVPRRRWI